MGCAVQICPPYLSYYHLCKCHRMAPELFALRPSYTPASDIYALGQVLFEVAARALPFSGVASQQLVPTFVLQGERDTIPPDVPVQYADLITQCWATAARERPSAEQVCEVLEKLVVEFAQGEEVSQPLKRSSIAGESVGVDVGDVHVGGVDSASPFRTGFATLKAPNTVISQLSFDLL